MVHRSANSHRQKVKQLPFAACVRRDEPLRPADQIELNETADRIAGPTGWYAAAGWREKADCKLIRFSTIVEAEEMQRWIDSSGIAERPMPKLGETKGEKVASAREVINWALSTGAARPIVQAYRRKCGEGEGHITGMIAAYTAAREAGRKSDGLVPAVDHIIRWAQESHTEWFYRYRNAVPGEAAALATRAEKAAPAHWSEPPVEPPAPRHRPSF